MASDSGHASSVLTEESSPKIEELIKSALEYFAYDDATVLAEAYYSRAKTDSALYLLSQCFQRSGRVKAAYSLLKTNGFRSAQCRYLYARCAYEMRRLQEAESTLRDEKLSTDMALHSSFSDSPVLSYAYSLLASILCETDRPTHALSLYKRSLTINPMSWSAIKGYYNLRGESLKDLFDKLLNEVAVAKEKRANAPSQSSRVVKADQGKSTPATKTPEIVTSSPSEVTTRRRVQTAAPKKKSIGLSHLRKKNSNDAVPETRRSLRLYSAQEDENVGRVHSTRQMHYSSRGLLLQQNQGKELRSSSRLNLISSSASRRATTGRSSPSTPIIPTDASKALYDNSLDEKEALETTRTRRSHVHPLSSVNSPLPALGSACKKSSSRSGSQNSVVSTGSRKSIDEEPMDLENAKPAPTTSNPQLADAAAVDSQDPVFCDIVEWIWKLSEIQRHFSCYECHEALGLLNELPLVLSQLPLSLELHGRVLVEDTQYQRAVVIFDDLYRRYPHHVEGLETYSSALWQLQDAHKLSALAADLTSRAGEHPESWCAAANCFSLQKQHETAVECLERAVRLNPRFGYTYALMGQELVALNDLRRAAQSFRQGIVYSHNDYRAWHGLGTVDEKEEKYGTARINFAKAVQLNPRNVALLCQLGVLEKNLHNPSAAMELLERGLSISPDNVVCRFNKARLLFDTSRFEEALKELEELRTLAPDEANVFFLLGRVNRKLGKQHDALVAFSWASEIDPRGEQTSHSAHDYEIPD